MALDLPSDLVVDLRQPVVGDSFNWEGVEPGAAKKSIVIHATASEAPDEDGFVLADYHVNHNGWGGCGVHFCVTKDEYAGRPNFSPGGVQIHYVGDLLSWRAGTANQNPGRIHIEISGLFTPGHGVPSANQLRAVRRLINHLLTETPELPSLQFYNQVTYHNAVPEQNTECPGWQHPQFNDWFSYLQGGPWPENLYPTPAPTPAPVPEPVPSAPTPIPVTVVPDYQATWTPHPDQRPVLRPGANALDATTDTVVVASIPQGTVVNIAGYFTHQNRSYARSVFAATHDKWNGVEASFFEPPTGQPSGPVPVSTPLVATPAPDPVAVHELSKLTAFQLLKELFAEIVAKLIRRKQA